MKMAFIGSKLLMKTSQSIEAQPGLELTSIFEQILPGNHILITAPIHRGIIFPISLKETLYVHFLTEEGRYDFTCLVVERPIIDGIYYLKAWLTSEITRSQRRDHFRIKKPMRARLAIEGKLTIDVIPPDAQDEGGIVEFDCITHDISAGGLSLYLTYACELNDIVVASLPVGPDEKMVNFTCEVVWVTECDRSDYSHLVGLKFIYESEREREDMEKYVFMLQYDMIRRK